MNFPLKNLGVCLILIGFMIQFAIQPPTPSTITVLLSGDWLKCLLIAMPFVQYLVALVVLLLTKRGAVALGGVGAMLAGDVSLHGELFASASVPWAAVAGPLWNLIVMMPLGRIAGGFLETTLNACFESDRASGPA